MAEAACDALMTLLYRVSLWKKRLQPEQLIGEMSQQVILAYPWQDGLDSPPSCPLFEETTEMQHTVSRSSARINIVHLPRSYVCAADLGSSRWSDTEH